MFDLSGKGALITGASGDIGAAIARALHANGANVALSGTRTERLEELATDLGGRCHVVPADLSDGSAVDALAATAAEALGSLDILINNAGLTRDNLAMRMKDDEWQAVLDVNLTAAFRLSRGVLRPMMKSRWGRIISVTSVVGATGNPGQVNSAASKAGYAPRVSSRCGDVRRYRGKSHENLGWKQQSTACRGYCSGVGSGIGAGQPSPFCRHGNFRRNR